MAMDLEKFGKTLKKANPGMGSIKSGCAYGYGCIFDAGAQRGTSQRGAAVGRLTGSGDTARGLPGKTSR